MQFGLFKLYNKEIHFSLGGTDILECKKGDFSSFIKLYLGWINPFVVESDTIISIKDFTTKSDSIIIAKEFNGIFSEYFMVDLFSKKAFLENSLSFGDARCGIRIYHIVCNIDKNGNILSSSLTTFYPLIRLMEKDFDGSFDFSYQVFSDEADLYYENEIFGDKNYYDYKMSDGNDIPFKLIVDSLSINEATLKIIFNK